MTQNDSLNRWSTWREIHAQPDIWAAWAAELDVDGLRGWLRTLDFEEIWFCGAGTSAYIGDILVAGLEGQGPFRSVPSTDLVSRPQALLKGKRPLVVSFGRSGNSTESIGTLDALDALAPNAPRLHITCNKDGALATRKGAGETKVILLPDETHDAGFAMTSSFSTMLYTALAMFDQACDVSSRLTELSHHLKNLLNVITVPDTHPDRIVFLGTGPLAFAAREAALKVMELSAGEIPALWDSTLGFRHGPKSFVMEGTDIVMFLSPESPASLYEADLVAELREQFPKCKITTVGPEGDLDISMPFGATWSAPVCIAVAQVLGVQWSDGMGLNVDNPFEGQGTLSRVVTGVKLYPVAS